MAILKKKATVQRLTKYLERRGWSGYKELEEANEEEGLILTGWESQRIGSIPLIIDPIIEKHAVLFTARNVASAPPDTTPADRLNGLLLVLAALNKNTVLGGWAFDPSNGEVVFQNGIPIASGDLPFEDFDHCIKTLVITVERYAPKLRSLVKGTSSASDVLA